MNGCRRNHEDIIDYYHLKNICIIFVNTAHSQDIFLYVDNVAWISFVIIMFLCRAFYRHYHRNVIGDYYLPWVLNLCVLLSLIWIKRSVATLIMHAFYSSYMSYCVFIERIADNPQAEQIHWPRTLSTFPKGDNSSIWIFVFFSMIAAFFLFFFVDTLSMLFIHLSDFLGDNVSKEMKIVLHEGSLCCQCACEIMS